MPPKNSSVIHICSRKAPALPSTLDPPTSTDTEPLNSSCAVASPMPIRQAAAMQSVRPYKQLRLVIIFPLIFFLVV